YLYDQATTENWEDFRSVLDKKLQKEKTILDKLSSTNNSKNEKGNQAWNVIKSSIIEAANRSIPRKKWMRLIKKNNFDINQVEEKLIINLAIAKQNKKFNLSVPWLPMGDLED
ncbi:2587_t:CDS:2, partial [Gigaspora margarita]